MKFLNRLSKREGKSSRQEANLILNLILSLDQRLVPVRIQTMMISRCGFLKSYFKQNYLESRLKMADWN